LKLTTIKTSLELLLTQTTDESVRTDIHQSITDCNEQIDRYDDIDYFDGRICIVSTSSITTLLNILTYDDYGKFYKTNGSCSFEQYSELVRTKYDLDLTDSTLESGYYLIRDLYRDNERFGHNNSDGTIRK
jgi:hypothetical protein